MGSLYGIRVCVDRIIREVVYAVYDVLRIAMFVVFSMLFTGLCG